MKLVFRFFLVLFTCFSLSFENHESIPMYATHIVANTGSAGNSGSFENHESIPMYATYIVANTGSAGNSGSFENHESIPMYATYIVTNTGSAGNSGASEASAKSIEWAYQNAVAGDIVYVKAGLYSGKNIYVSNSGTLANPIRFIGYKNTVGDIDSGADGSYSTFERGDTVDAAEMPLIQENRNANQQGQGRGIHIDFGKQYIEFENFQIRYYNQGVLIQGNNNTLKNIIAVEQGDFDPSHRHPTSGSDPLSNAFGNGIQIQGNTSDPLQYCVGNKVINCFVENAGQVGFVFSFGTGFVANGNTMNSNNIYNNVDYHFQLGGGCSNSTFSNTRVYRTNDMSHLGHGIVAKGQQAITNNIIEDFYIENTYLEVQFDLTRNNTFRRGVVTLQGGESNWVSGMRLANGSDSNHFEDIVLNNCGIKFADWIDGSAGDVAESSDNNTFLRITGNGGYAAIAFSPLLSPLNTNADANDNVFTDCTFDGYTYLYERGRPNSGTTLTNVQVTNTTSLYPSGSYTPSVAYSSVNFSGNGFSNQTGTNITSHDPQYVNASGGNFQPQNALSLGTGVGGRNIGSFQGDVIIQPIQKKSTVFSGIPITIMN